MYGDLDNIIEKDISLISDEIIYYMYLGELPKLYTKFYSPFIEETNPSFYFYSKNNKLLFKCFSTGFGGDSIQFVKTLFKISYEEAVEKIYKDYAEGGKNGEKFTKEFIESIELTRNEKESSTIDVITCEFSKEDLSYWNKYGLDIDDLNYFDYISDDNPYNPLLEVGV